MNARPLVFSGRASIKLARDITDLLQVGLSDLEIMQFGDGEPWYRIPDPEKIKGRHVVVVQSTPEYSPKSYFDLWGIMAAIKPFSPRRMTVVMPFMGFRRQERDKEGGEAVMAKLVAELTVKAGATDVILCDPHSPLLATYFNDAGAITKVISGNQIFSELMSHRDLTRHKVFSPDIGRESEATQLAEILGLELLIGKKLRFDIDKSKSEGVEGDARDQIIIIREDEISTGGTMINACKDLHTAGASSAIILATHGVFAAGSVQRLKRIDFIREIWITDSIYLPWEKRIPKIKVKSLAHLLAKSIMEIHQS